jgi:hypothetical protein
MSIPVIARVVLLVGVACSALLIASCSGSSAPSTPDGSAAIPGSLSPTTTDGSLHTTSSLAPGSPVIGGLRSTVAESCVDGRAELTVTAELSTTPPVRVLTLVAGGNQSAVNPVDGQEEIIMTGSLPCDGSTTMVIVIATGFDAQSSTQTVVAQAPPAPPLL